MGTSRQSGLFKSYDSNQLMLLPPSLSELIPSSHPARVVNEIIDRVDLENLFETYQGGGAPSYHPRLLLKVLVYGYLTNIYSSRKLEQACRENIQFMWLCGMEKPDHNTINRFRSSRLKDSLKKIFANIVMLLSNEGIVDIKQVYVDGTKVEANANKYTFIWAKSIKTRKEKIGSQLKEIWEYAESVAHQEMSNSSLPDLEKIDSKSVTKAIEEINSALKNKSVEPKVKAKITRVKRDWPKMLDKYAEQEKQLNGRNSLSKTDPDATFMRMKDDHMQNGQLKAAYNWQLSTNNQFAINYSIHQSPGDSTLLKEHAESYQMLYDKNPDTLIADAGYGSEENYEFLENEAIEGYVKYNYFHKEQKKKTKEKLSRKENLYYNKEQDYYICPIGQKMTNIGEEEKENRNGFLQTYTLYQAQNCEACPLRGACYKAKGNRIIQVNKNLERHRKRARENLLSEEGLKHRSQRPQDVEAVFGNIKQNKGFRRFMLRGKKKVEIEVGLLCIAHNLAKATKIMKKAA